MWPPSITVVVLLAVGCARGGYLPPPAPPLLHPHGPALTVLRHAPPAVPPYSTQINIFRWLAAFPPPVLHRALLLAQGHLHHVGHHAHLHPVLHHPAPPVLHHPAPPVLHHPSPSVLHHLPPQEVHHPVHHSPAVFHSTPVLHQTPVAVPPAPVTPVLPAPAPLPSLNGISFSAGPGLALLPGALPGVLRLGGGYLRPFNPTLFPSISPTTPAVTPASLNPTLFSGTPLHFPPGFFSSNTPTTTTFEFDANGNIVPSRTPSSSPPQTFPAQERPAPLPNNPAGLTFQDVQHAELPVRQQLRSPYRHYLPPSGGITRATSGNLVL